MIKSTIQRNLLLILFGFYSLNLTAQTGKLIKADKHFNSFKFKEAIEEYQDLAKGDYKATTRTYVDTRLGDCYRLINDPVNAEKWYKIAIESGDCDTITYFNFAKVLFNNKKYDEARIWVKKYLDMNPQYKAGLKELATFEDYDKIYADSAWITIALMDKVNSPKADFSPAFVNGKIIFVSSRDTISYRRSSWTDEPFYTLYECEMDSDYNLLSGKKLFGEVNTRFHEGPMSYDQNTGILYFTRNNYSDHKKRTSKDNTNYLKVFQAKLVDSLWKDVKELPFNNDEYTCAHPAISPDGQRLYFISNMPGGYGGTDIYYCDKNEQGWTTPVNAGRPINTAGNELFPTFSHNNTLYFASTGHPGLGGLDVFVYENGNIRNIGYPINTSYDDFGLTTLNDEKGFFSSNRNGGLNNDDIFYFRKNQPPVAKNDKLFIEIIDNQYNIGDQLINCLENDSDPNNDIDVNSLKTIYQSNKNSKITIDSIGNILYKPSEGFKGTDTLQYVIFDKGNLSDTAFVFITINTKNPPDATKDYALVIKNTLNNDIWVTNNDVDPDEDLRDDYVEVVTDPQHGTVKEVSGRVTYTPDKDYVGKDFLVYKIFDEAGLTDTDTAFIDVVMIFMGKVVNKDFELNLTINFETGKWDITPQAALILDSLITGLKENPGFEIELGAHTDSRGSAVANQTLSQKRAESAVNYIISKGIDKGRLTAKGYGESQLTNRCADGVKCNTAEHAANRRVTIRLTKY